jgi:hypothetical protein
MTLPLSLSHRLKVGQPLRHNRLRSGLRSNVEFFRFSAPQLNVKSQSASTSS